MFEDADPQQTFAALCGALRLHPDFFCEYSFKYTIISTLYNTHQKYFAEFIRLWQMQMFILAIPSPKDGSVTTERHAGCYCEGR